MNQSRDRLFSLGSGCRIDCRIVRPSETQLLGSAASAWAASAINAAFHPATRVVSYAAGSSRQFLASAGSAFLLSRKASPASRPVAFLERGFLPLREQNSGEVARWHSRKNGRGLWRRFLFLLSRHHLPLLLGRRGTALCRFGFFRHVQPPDRFKAEIFHRYSSSHYSQFET